MKYIISYGGGTGPYVWDAEIIDREAGLPELIEALQDALCCLDGSQYEGGQIHDEEPYAKQKQAIAKASNY